MALRVSRRDYDTRAARQRRPCGGNLRSALAGKQKVRQTQRPPNYRVLLHNDAVNKREYVVQVLLKACLAPLLAAAPPVTRHAAFSHVVSPLTLTPPRAAGGGRHDVGASV